MCCRRIWIAAAVALAIGGSVAESADACSLGGGGRLFGRLRSRCSERQACRQETRSEARGASSSACPNCKNGCCEVKAAATSDAPPRPPVTPATTFVEPAPYAPPEAGTPPIKVPPETNPNGPIRSAPAPAEPVK